MCFRPPEVSAPIQCPTCGEGISTMGGGTDTCPHCGADVTEEMIAAGVTLRGEVKSFGAPSAPSTQATPRMPKPPAPAPPKV